MEFVQAIHGYPQGNFMVAQSHSEKAMDSNSFRPDAVALRVVGSLRPVVPVLWVKSKLRRLVCRGSWSQMEVSWNRGTPKSSIWMGFSIINHPFWGSPIYGNRQLIHSSFGFSDKRNHPAMSCPRAPRSQSETTSTSTTSTGANTVFFFWTTELPPKSLEKKHTKIGMNYDEL